MDYGALRDYVDGAMCKSLPAIDISANKSHQHEFQGSKPLRALLGDSNRKNIPARFVYLDDEATSVDAGRLSWYDSRRNNPNRSAEWRLYYTDNEAVRSAHVGDTLTLLSMRDGSLSAIITKRGSSIDAQIRWLFGVGEVPERFSMGSTDMQIGATASMVLEAIGIEVHVPKSAEDMLSTLYRTNGFGLPSTREFSAFCRSTLGDVDYAHDDPDEIVFRAYEREEMLFRAYERQEVELNVFRLTESVDGMLEYAMSLFQRRKSRAGKALEHTLETIFDARGIRYKAQAITENDERPDFLFPSEEAYHDPSFPWQGLTMLGAKTTCKDRWRQVLNEAHRIPIKHLVTLESPISVKQTNGMREKGLQLVVPSPLQDPYTDDQRNWLWSVSDFIGLVEECERAYA